MSHRVLVAEPAVRDLDDIRRRIALEGGQSAADAFVDRLAARIDGLKDWPERGPVPPELAGVTGGRVRQASLPPYRLFHEVEGGSVLVFAVVHARRDLAALLQERLAR